MVARIFKDLQKEMADKEDRSKERTQARVSSLSARAIEESPAYRERVYQIVRRIPVGRVMTYGQIADMLGEGYTARTVGFVMHSADEETPWHRVINAQGGCSTTHVVLPHDKQQRMLEAEGIEFNARGRCELGHYRWIPEEEAGDERRKNEEDEAQASLFPD
jgi:methylated-DNA-protein-cysteine methyltransferase-like protein